MQELRVHCHRVDEWLEVTLLKKLTFKIIVNTVRRFIIYTVQNFVYIFEFTISVRKAWFSSLAYDPAPGVPAQKWRNGLSQFAHLEKKQVLQLVSG